MYARNNVYPYDGMTTAKTLRQFHRKRLVGDHGFLKQIEPESAQTERLIVKNWNDILHFETKPFCLIRLVLLFIQTHNYQCWTNKKFFPFANLKNTNISVPKFLLFLLEILKSIHFSIFLQILSSTWNISFTWSSLRLNTTKIQNATLCLVSMIEILKTNSFPDCSKYFRDFTTSQL